MIKNYIEDLILYSIDKKLIQSEDFDYVYNRLTNLLLVENNELIRDDYKSIKHLSIILDLILDYAYDKGFYSPNSTKERDLYESLIMDVFSPLPSSLNRTFYHYFNKNSQEATDFFYKMSQDNNYIKMDRISKNVLWKSTTKYGIFDFAINLSKPEKDPRDIINEFSSKQSKYPRCMLCKENVGFYGDTNKPGRSNHRIIKLNLNDEEFYFQYSPYVYYNEHSIVLMKEHLPMNVSEKTFKRLLDFVDQFPHYFLGSNAGLPIVGGSILSHEHYQGGRHNFAIEDAKEVFVSDFDGVSLKYLIWPLTVLRLESKNRDILVEKAVSIFEFWENYSDLDVSIKAKTDNKHNAITPIARKSGDIYTLDIALRNNLTTDEFPLGIFHPHPEHHNIKKENIGLIEVMGLAVLPPRLKNELKSVKNSLQNNVKLPNEFNVHNDWLIELRDRYNGQDMDQFIEEQVADKFIRALGDSSVFKQTEIGNKRFQVFLTKLTKTLR